jgi:Sec7-like guanine-nucleotide exchange factor
MAYSVIMLHTDVHSEKIEKSRKMTKAQFVKNNIRICPTLKPEFLEQMYERISKEKFKTENNCNFVILDME